MRQHWLVTLVVAASGCHQGPSSPTRFDNMGTFAAHYDAATGSLRFEPADFGAIGGTSVGENALTVENNSTGVTARAIENTALAVGQINKYMGLLDPDSCTTDWNASTGILSFYSKIVNRSNLANNGAPYVYTDPVNYPPNTSFLGPFYMPITGFYPVSEQPNILVGMNTASGGINLTNSDADHNGWIDSIWPDFRYNPTAPYPHYDYTPFVPSGRMAPGDDTGCVVFMQFSLSVHESFTLYFDMLAVKESPLMPSTPQVTSHSNGDWVNDNIILSGDNCTPDGVVWVEGGQAAASTTCQADASYAVAVYLRSNSVNYLSVYQVVNGETSGAASLAINHDQIAPTVLGMSPANGDPTADPNANCVITFSEPMDPTTLTPDNLTFVDVQSGGTITDFVTSSADHSQAMIAPTGKPLTGGDVFECNALVGLLDRAGNALAETSTARFTTAGAATGQDVSPPRVLGLTPPDNAPGVSPDAVFTIDFDEPINPATIEGSVVDPDCDLDGVGLPTVFVFELNSCNDNPQPVVGTTTLDIFGTRATFTPSSLLKVNNCYGIVVTNCIADLTGNELPSRGQRTVAAYGSADFTYNTYNVFFTGTLDTQGPKLVHVSPAVGATDVHPTLFATMVFNEPLDPATVIGNNFFVTPFGETSRVPLTLTADTSLQVVTFEIAAPYAAATTYVPTTTGSATDLSGNPMLAPQTGRFTTSAADTVVPTVVSFSPSAGVQVADRCPMLDIYFSEPMNVHTLNQSTIRLIEVATGLARPTVFEISDDAMHVRLIANSSLGNGAWKIQVSKTVATPPFAGVEDRAALTLNSDASSTFTVSADITPPTVLGVVPSARGRMYQNGSVLVFFSEEMDKSTLTAANLFVNLCNPIVYAAGDGTYAIVNCINQWGTGNDTITIKTSVRDFGNVSANQSCEAEQGQAVKKDEKSNFTVDTGIDAVKPTVSSLSDVYPQDRTVSMANNVVPSVTFSEAIDPRTVFGNSIFLLDEAGNRVSVRLSLSIDARKVSLTPLSPLGSGNFTIIASTAIRDLGGGNPYDGAGGEQTPVADILKTCFATDSGPCP